MQMTIPDFGLVVLIGPAGAGKTTFARKHFRTSEILSSDLYRKVVADDELGSRTTRAAFDVMAYIAKKRLEARRITVIDATNLHREHRAVFANLARQQSAPLTAIVFELSENACQHQNGTRSDTDPLPHHIVHRQWQTLKRGLKRIPKEGFRRTFRIKSPEDGRDAHFWREPLFCDRRSDPRAVDIIGDVHGCRDELENLLRKLGYAIERETAAEQGGTRYRVTPPENRQALFLGDLIDRGPDSPGTLELVMDMVESGAAIAVQGNHDNKLMRALAGRNVHTTHGLAETLEALEKRPEAFRERVRVFLESMGSHFVLDNGKLVTSHAGMPEHLQNRSGRDVREFGLYGDAEGSTDENEFPVRGDWTKAYRGAAQVVYGHTPTRQPEWLNNTLSLDTGCVWGGSLTAFRYPEREIVQVPALDAYQTPAPTAMDASETGTSQQTADQDLDLSELQGVLRINTRLHGTVTVRPENAAAALESVSRFAVDPRWLIYIPPTMAPCRAAPEGDLLERPAEAFDHYRKRNIATVVCQEKHMGSRGIVVVTRDPATARTRFGIDDQAGGCIYTRTGRRFFDNRGQEEAILDRFQIAFEKSGLWETLETDWACLDCEIMPWNAKGAGLIKRHFTPVATAARMGLGKAIEALRMANERDRDNSHDTLLLAMEQRRLMTEQYDTAYQQYNWPVESIEDLKIAPFHLMATENAVHADKSHHWHMATIRTLCEEDSILQATRYLTVDVDNDDHVANATKWWTSQTANGSEGMVVKPLDFVTRTERGIVAPALKCRGREYLRIIYGPEYTRDDQIVRLRKRTTGRKMTMALREFALGIESLEQFVQRAPLRRVHQAAFGVLALEAEPLDPRL